MTLDEALMRSMSYDEIVTLPHRAVFAEELDVICDDSADTGEVVEYWGTDDDGGEWRVHLVRERWPKY